MQNVVRLPADVSCFSFHFQIKFFPLYGSKKKKKKLHLCALCHVLFYFFLRQSLFVCQSVGWSFGYPGVLTLQVQKKVFTPRPWESGLTQESLVCGANITDPARGLRCLDTDLVSMDPLSGLMILSPTVDGLRSWYRSVG